MLPVRLLQWVDGHPYPRCCPVKVEELQQKVRVLQAVRYGAMEAEEGPDTHATASLEAALLAKARRLEHDLTMTRLKVAELTGSPRVPIRSMYPSGCLRGFMIYIRAFLSVEALIIVTMSTVCR